MRIVEDTPARLRLSDSSLWVTFVCFAASAVLIGAFALKDLRVLMPAALFAIFGVAFARSTEAVFDNGRKVASLKRLDMFRRTCRELAYSDIRNVAIDSMMGGSTATANVVMYRLKLETTEGDVPLTATYEAGETRYDAMRERISAVVLGQAAAPLQDPVEDLARSGRTIEAIAALRARENLSLAEARDRVDAIRGGDAA